MTKNTITKLIQNLKVTISTIVDRGDKSKPWFYINSLFNDVNISWMYLYNLEFATVSI